MGLLDIEDSGLRRWVFVGLVVLSLISFLFTAVSLFFSVAVGGIGNGVPAPDGPAGYLVETAGVSGSLAVSLALAAIYLSQNRILNEQAETMREQAATMRKRNRPILAPTEKASIWAKKPAVDESDSDADGFKPDDSEDQVPWVTVPVENHGNNVAHRIQLVTLVYTDSWTDDGPFSGRSRVDVASTSTEPISGGAVQADDDKALLRTVPQFSRGTDPDSPFLPFYRRIERLLQEADCPVRFGFALVYTDSVQEQFYVPLNTAYSIAPADYDDFDCETLTPEGLKQIIAHYDVGDLIEQTGWPEDDALARQ